MQPLEDDTIGEIWLQIFLKLLTLDSEYLIGFLKHFWGHWKTDPDFQVAKMVLLDNFSLFFDLQRQ